MSEITLAKRYSKALFDYAKETGKLDEVIEDIKVIREALKNRGFLLFVRSPILSALRKREILDKIFDTKVSDLSKKYLHLIVGKGREKFLPEITQAFIDEYKALQKIETFTLTTAKTLTRETLKEFERHIIATLPSASNIEFETKVNPDLIGGFVLEYGDKLYDSSVRHKLNTIKKTFTGSKA